MGHIITEKHKLLDILQNLQRLRRLREKQKPVRSRRKKLLGPVGDIPVGCLLLLHHINRLMTLEAADHAPAYQVAPQRKKLIPGNGDVLDALSVQRHSRPAGGNHPIKPQLHDIRLNLRLRPAAADENPVSRLPEPPDGFPRGIRDNAVKPADRAVDVRKYRVLCIGSVSEFFHMAYSPAFFAAFSLIPLEFTIIRR